MVTDMKYMIYNAHTVYHTAYEVDVTASRASKKWEYNSSPI